MPCAKTRVARDVIHNLLCALVALGLPSLCIAQRVSTAPDTTKQPVVTAGEADYEPGRRNILNRKDYNLGFTTFNFGGGFLYEVADYAQDSAAREQIHVVTAGRMRDARLLFNGRVKTKRPFTWQLGYMYDGPDAVWRFRQTGIMVGVPEIASSFFVGRAKEGISLSRVMPGYDIFTMERYPFSDATMPILVDGVKWLGSLPKYNFIWNIGWFTDVVSKWEAFSQYDNQIAGRLMWVPMESDSSGSLFHIGLNGRIGKPDRGQLRLKSRPQAFPAPSFMDTGDFDARVANLAGLEVYYRPNNWIFALEYFMMNAETPETADPVFHGGEALISWLVTGETRGYNRAGGWFKRVVPAKTVLQSGLGAFEAVLSFSYTDLTSEQQQGGMFWRITPMLNWHFTDNSRLQLEYGYGVLDRFAMKGATQFFQTRWVVKY